MAEFEIFKNCQSVKKVKWNDEPLLIGRDAMADICLPDDLVSRRHAKIFVEKGGLAVEDLKSPNGTFLNGRKAFRNALTDGDHIEFGIYVVVVHTKKGERFADTPILQGEVELGDEDLMEGGLIIGEEEGPSTKVVGPGMLARMRQEHDIKMNPHLICQLGHKTAYFPLKFQVTTIGSDDACQVRITHMNRKKAVVIEQVAEGRYQAKKLGLCVKLRVGGKLVRQTDLEDNLALDVEGRPDAVLSNAWAEIG